MVPVVALLASSLDLDLDFFQEGEREREFSHVVIGIVVEWGKGNWCWWRTIG